MVIIENVEAFATLHKEAFAKLVKGFESSHYTVVNKSSPVYDCRDHGIPQSRRRMLLVAITGKLATPWVEPEPMAMTAHLDCFVDGRGPTELTETQRLRRDEEVARWRSKVKNNKDPIIVDIAASARFASSQLGCCPTLTATRASNHHSFYCTTKGMPQQS